MDRTPVRIPELDGLRGLAILMVMACHFSADPAPDRASQALGATAAALWVGVDLFFVLSGFLITGVLLSVRGQPGALRDFYIRRVLRIWPAYLAALVVLLVILPDTDAYDAVDRWWFGSHRWYYWLHAMNFVPTPEGVFGYHTVHFWSLSLEEQFYIVWPLAVLTLSDTELRKVLVAAAAGEFVLRVWLAAHASLETRWAAQHLLHFQPLAAGAWLAIVARDPHDSARYARLAKTGALAGALALGVLFLHAPGLDKYSPWLFALTITASTVGFSGLLVRALTGGAASRWAGFVRLPTLRWVGRYSYAMYIVHMPLVAAAERTDFSWRVFPTIAGTGIVGYLAYLLVLTAATCCLAFLSWHALEKHCLRLRRFFPRPDFRHALLPMPSSLSSLPAGPNAVD